MADEDDIYEVFLNNPADNLAVFNQQLRARRYIYHGQPLLFPFILPPLLFPLLYPELDNLPVIIAQTARNLAALPVPTGRIFNLRPNVILRGLDKNKANLEASLGQF